MLIDYRVVEEDGETVSFLQTFRVPGIAIMSKLILKGGTTQNNPKRPETTLNIPRIQNRGVNHLKKICTRLKDLWDFSGIYEIYEIFWDF